MAGGEYDAAVAAVFADDAGGGRSRQQAALANDDPGHTVGRCHSDNDLDRLPIIVSAITAHDECAPPEVRLGIEYRLDKVFQVVGRLEDPDLFTQARGAGALVRKWLCGNP